MDQYIGKMLDNRYEILERIGTGGMAIVYKAKCHRLNRLVAVKILKSDLAQDEDFRRRFHAESKAVAMLSHPNIVSVYDVSQSHDVEYIVMELIDGITLKQYMEKRGHLDWRESLHFITQIMRGLSHAHGRGIVHRDIKPQNIMVLRDGSVKVADFGIACLANSAQTLTQEALGSVHYISPEQARGDRPDARSDIYSAGVMLYEMLTDRLPFEGDSAVSVAIQHLSSIPLAPREINRDIPEPLELICMKAMAPDLERRYVSADAMVSDLEAFRKNPGVELDISLEDLHPEEPDEPTRLIHTAAAQPARQTDSGRDYDRKRDYDRDRRPASSGGRGKQAAAIASVSLVVVVALFFLLRAVFSSVGGTQSYTVPVVTGYKVEAARQLDTVQGIFELKQVGEQYDDMVPAGEILSQEPKAGETRKSDLVINVVVSLGERTDEMPDVVNKDVQIADITLKQLKEDLGLVITREEESSEEITQGWVIRTEPEAGKPLKKGDTVTLYVSTGPEKEPVTVPSFLTLPIEKAQEQIKTLELLCTVKEAESTEAAGTVIDQSIPGGTQANKGDTIELTVSKGTGGVPSGGSGVESIVSETFSLPSDGRATVSVRVTVDGEEQYKAESVDVALHQGSIAVELHGSGTATAQIYFDGVLDSSQTKTVDFNE